MQLPIHWPSPRGPCLFPMAWGWGTVAGLGTLGGWEPASQASGRPPAASRQPGWEGGDLPGVSVSVWGRPGAARGGPRRPCSWQRPGKRPEDLWGCGGGSRFSHWPGGAEWAGARGGQGGSGQRRGLGPTCCRPRLGRGRGEGRAGPGSLQGAVHQGGASPGQRALARVCRLGEGDAVGAVCPASGSVGRAGGLRACPQPWPWEDLASGGP